MLNLEELEIDAPNLITFEYSGPELNVYLKNVPSLADVKIGVSSRYSNFEYQIQNSRYSNFEYQTLNFKF